MITKAEWKETADHRLAENLALRVLIIQADKILDRPSEDLAAAKKRIKRARRKLEIAKKISD